MQHSNRARGGIIIRAVFAILVIAAAATIFLIWRAEQGSDAVRNEMLAIVREIGLPEDWLASAEEYVYFAHEKAFRKAMDVTKSLGEKFNENAYFNEVFDRITSRAREDGKEELARRFDIARDSYQLRVNER